MTIKPWQERVHELGYDAGELHEAFSAEIAELRAELIKHRSEWDRLHHLMKKHGLHPGRTDDDLIEILDAHLAPGAQPVPEGMVLVSNCKGYALLGTGNYCINHTAEFDEKLGAELVITFAGESDKSNNRQIGESRENPDGSPPIQSEDMIIRIGFINERGLYALEDQLRLIRELHFKNDPSMLEAAKP